MGHMILLCLTDDDHVPSLKTMWEPIAEVEITARYWPFSSQIAYVWAKLILAGHFGQTIIKKDDFLHVQIAYI